MSFTIGTATFTNGSSSVTNVSLTSGRLSYFSSGTRMVVGTNPVVAEVEAIDAPAVNAITLREPWAFATGTYAFLANMTSEGIRDAAQTLRTYIDGLSVAPAADSTVVRTATGAVRAAEGVNADEAFVVSQATEAATASKLVKRTATGAAKVANAANADEAVALGQLPDDVADLYARNNVLGTVSQVAGVPTGAIIERGGNANGAYIKYADGTVHMWIVGGATHTIATAYGALYRSTGFNLTLPVTLNGIDTACAGSGNWVDGSGNTGYISYSNLSQTQITGCTLVSPVSLSSATRTRFLYIVGRWY